MPPTDSWIVAIIPYFVIGLYFPMRLIEILAHKRSFPKIRGWDFIGLLLLWYGGKVNQLLIWALPMQWLATHHLIDGSRLGTAGGTIAGVLATSYGWYHWHRLAHRSDLLWRFVHQTHHSVPRVDVTSSLFVSPLDITFQALVDIGITNLVLGLNLEATLLTVYAHSFSELFHHMNIRTPAWLGWFIQRPEAHCVHHQRGVHAYNYSNFPLWDMLGGTFRNPENFTGEVGFEPAQARRVLAMLVGVDVHAPHEKA